MLCKKLIWKRYKERIIYFKRYIPIHSILCTYCDSRSTCHNLVLNSSPDTPWSYMMSDFCRHLNFKRKYKYTLCFIKNT